MSRNSSSLCVVSVGLLEFHEGIEVNLGDLHRNLRSIGKGGVYDMLGVLICRDYLRIGRIFHFRSVLSMFVSLTLVLLFLLVLLLLAHVAFVLLLLDLGFYLIHVL
uniref:Uncharacterized protein n=1 Tax=Chromera velia CCMP2878 TaxID=1169474 RepID=A0A0G4HKE1_9ALVE|eukprot:Cvel_28496.t1-p1 / transcript=Cvel_28496.t1 / gene=Cvel_28496 / organism=Chromera_velia_CCMP2878 / gene_product=hypothetical protein / transcript_product=hypothetical protein / location=Cvel_scaffold3741:8693-9007(+) / protein_length=105 / sequence_SO=supercontig / SO=protein_coding / is_pseudo=false